MFWNKRKETAKVEWFKLTEVEQLQKIVEESYTTPVLIYKHSTRCGISSMAFDRLVRGWDEEFTDKLKPYFLDLVAFRNVSDEVARQFGIFHQSPQVILIKNGKAIYDDSHMAISFDIIKKQL